jgi:hypothetical protein
MKKFKGFSSTEIVFIMTFAFAIALGAWIGFGQALKMTIATNNPSRRSANDRASVSFQDPKALLSNDTSKRVKATNGGYRTPLETVLTTKLSNPDYVQTSGSSGRMNQIIETELPALVREYVGQMSGIIYYLDAVNPSADATAKANIGASLTAITNLFTTYEADIQSQNLYIRKIALAALYSEIRDEVHILLSSAVSTYIASLTPSAASELLQLYTIDLRSISSTIDMSVDQTLYNDFGLVYDSADPFNPLYDKAKLKPTYTADEIIKYSTKIQLTMSSNYTTLLGATYNTETLCNTYPDMCVRP